ncbi:hypothetical protein EBI01_19870 [Marinomonas rhizomae]|nr:hypothetical protein EBI01_19870 [Marinomonas rhizomae]
MVVAVEGLSDVSRLFMMGFFVGEVSMKTTLRGIFLVSLLMTLSACVFMPPGGPNGGPGHGGSGPGNAGGSPTVHR